MVKALKILAPFVTVVICVPLLIAMLFFIWPQALLNSGTLKMALTYGGRAAGISSQFSKAELHVSSDNLWRKKFFLHFDDLCVDSKSGFIKGCFSEVSLNAKIQIQKPYFKIVEIGPLVISGQSFSLNPKPSAPEPQAKPSHLLQDILPADLHNLRVLPFDIRVQDAQVKTAGLFVSGNLRLTDEKTLTEIKPWEIHLELDAQEASEKLAARGHLVLSSNDQILTGPIDLNGTVKAQTPLTKPFQVSLQASLFDANNGFMLRVSSSLACLDSKEGPIRGCLNELDLGARGHCGASGLSIETLAPVRLSSNHFSLNLDKLGSATPKSEGANAQPSPPSAPGATADSGQNDIIKHLSGLRFEDVNVKLPALELINGGELIAAKLSIISQAGASRSRKTQVPAPNDEELNLKLNVAEPQSNLTAHADLRAKRGHGVLILSGPVGLNADGLIVETHTSLQLSSRDLEFSLDTLLDSKPWAAHAFVKGVLAGNNLKGTISNLGAHNSEMTFRGPQTEPCLFDIDLNQRSKLGCNISLKFVDKQIDMLVGNPLLDLNMDLTTAFPPSDQSPWTGFVAIKVPSLKNHVVSASGEVRALFDKTKFDNDLLKNLNIRTDFAVEISDFADWVNKTYSTSFAVPAPINALKGKVTLSSQGTLKGVYSKIPLHFATDLRGKDQALLIDGNGTFGTVAQGTGYVPELDAEVVFKEVQLMLPRYPDSKLNAAPPPALVPDGRITNMKAVRKAEQGNVAEKPGFLYDIRLKTADGVPIKLISNLTLGPIPIALDLSVKTVEGLRGKVGIQKFPLELFGHKAEIVRLNLNFVSMRLEENRIDGEATLGINDYKIIIDLSGNPKGPVVRFYSEPPLPQNQIIPVVLFGKTPESLDVDQKNSSNSFQAALQDQALPLASFFFLASTPIESVGYDTQQKIFTAKFRLRQGLSLDVGSNGSQVNQIGLNKRLGKSWSIRTYMKNPTDQTQSQSVTAFLEKLFQY